MSNVPSDLVAQLAGSRHGEVRIVDPADLTDDECRTVPSWWVEAASLQGPNAVRRATTRWRDVVPGGFTATLDLFDRRAAGVFIGRETRTVSRRLMLIYALNADAGARDRFVCWYGYLPADHLDNRTSVFRPGVKADLTQLPEKLRSFYTDVHNRFEVAGWGCAGLFAVDDLFTLDGEPEDYELAAGGHAKPHPDALLPIFGSSWGNVCLELGTDMAWHQDDELLQPLGDFLPALDSCLRRFCSPLR